MKFEEVVSSLREGKYVRRASWNVQQSIKVHSLMKIVIFIKSPLNYTFIYYTPNLEDLEATDWEVK